MKAALLAPGLGGAVTLPGHSLAASSPALCVLLSPCPDVWLFLTSPSRAHFQRYVLFLGLLLLFFSSRKLSCENDP